jgi:hypothetical protein
MFWSAVVGMGSHAYESRRLAVLCGFRGRGTFGYFRGWLKTAYVELSANDEQVPPAALREWRVLRLGSGYVAASLVAVVPLLLF